MKQKLILIFSLFALIVNGQEKGIEFFTGTFEEAIEEAKTLNRNVFIDFSTSWCGPCKQMENFVFTDSIVGNFYNKNFICLKYDAEKGEGIILKNRFEVKAYPTLLYLSPELEIELKHIGFKDPKEFIELGNSVVNEKSSYKSIQNSLTSNNSNSITPLKFDSFLNSISQFEKDSVLLDYFQSVPQKKWYTPQYFSLIESHSHSIFSPLANFIIVNREKYSESFGKARIDKFISRLMSFAFGTPSDLYGFEVEGFSDNEVKEVLFNKLKEIDSTLAHKNRLDNEIIILCIELEKYPKNDESWTILVSKVKTYNEHYTKFDKEWYNVPDRWLYVALNLVPNKLEKRNHLNDCLKQMKNIASEEDFELFAEYLCIGTVQEYVNVNTTSRTSTKELSTALEVLASSYRVKKVWANQFLTRINLDNKEIIENKESLMKNAL